MQTEKLRSSEGATPALVAVGVLLVVLSPVPDWLGLGGRPGFGIGQTLVAVGGLLLVALGLLMRSGSVRWLWIGRRLTHLYRLMAFSVFNLVLLIAGMEFIGDLIDRRVPLPAPETYSPYYASQPWARQYWEEFERVEKQIVYEPYAVWRSDIFSGETINIGPHGVRRTGTSSDNAETEIIFAFGGSAMWGQGAPDDRTIPAFLQTELTEPGRSVQVENFGERGHVATQSLIRLILELQAGRVPESVIFYHGVNDVAVALAGDAGSHFGAAHIANRLERPFSTWLNDTRLLKLLRPFLPAPKVHLEAPSDEDLARLVNAIVDNYQGTYRILEGLSNEYGFEVFCFWQPYRALSQDPRSLENLLADAAGLDRLLAATYGEIERRTDLLEHLDSLAGVLEPADEMAWVDQVHLTPHGNRIVARAIASAMHRRSPEAASSIAETPLVDGP